MTLKQSIRILFKSAFLALMVVGMSLMFIFIHDVLTQCDYFKAESITVTGGQRLTPDQILKTADIEEGVNLVSLNLKMIRKRLLAHPWIAEAEKLPDFEGEDWYALNYREESILGLGVLAADSYDKKAAVIATNLMRKNIRIPLVVSESGQIINGVHRLFAAREIGIEEWPIITIPDEQADVALHFLNYLSMDYHVDGDFGKLLRYSAYRRPQNNRGAVPKAYRFWANGERTLLDKDSYSTAYWRKFRDLHGRS